jgi:diguanylate cyclase (GGDEF)-like protein/putative nucleotidyltransferase with HDIG domain
MRGRAQREDLARQLAEAQARAAQLEGELRAGADRDGLTGLASLARLRTALEIECDRGRRHGRPLSLAVLDVDGFRDVNSRSGHAAGDVVLRTVADVLRGATRTHDVVARTGGDEFTVLMPETELGGAEACCQRVLVDLESAAGEGVHNGVRLSAGVAEFHRQQTPGQLVGAAHAALDEARREGGARVSAGKRDAGAVSGSQHDAVSALASALIERDRYTGEHSESVVDLVGAVACNLGLPDEEVDLVKAAALLHDIGKVAIPDEILNKPAKLTPEEWKIMMDHTVVGERILRAIPGLGGVARIVRHEHERWDGGGYPDGLAGDDIPVGARIILAADAYHAMTSDRPYREAMSHADALDELVRGAGSQFDPAVVEILVGQLYGARQAGALA